MYRVAEAYFRLLQARELLESGLAAVRQVTGTWNWSGRGSTAVGGPGRRGGAALAEAVSRRPELGASLSQTRAAAHQVEAARAGKRPSGDFIGNFSTFDINASSGGNGLFVGVIASVNLLDGRRTRAQV